MRRTARPTSCTLAFFFFSQPKMDMQMTCYSPLFSWNKIKIDSMFDHYNDGWKEGGVWPKNYFLTYFHIKHTHYTHTLRAPRNQFINSKNNRTIQKYKIKLEIKKIFISSMIYLFKQDKGSKPPPLNPLHQIELIDIKNDKYYLWKVAKETIFFLVIFKWFLFSFLNLETKMLRK
jgi:hypothetical protein